MLALSLSSCAKLDFAQIRGRTLFLLIFDKLDTFKIPRESSTEEKRP